MQLSDKIKDGVRKMYSSLRKRGKPKEGNTKDYTAKGMKLMGDDGSSGSASEEWFDAEDETRGVPNKMTEDTTSMSNQTLGLRKTLKEHALKNDEAHDDTGLQLMGLWGKWLCCFFKAIGYFWSFRPRFLRSKLFNCQRAVSKSRPSKTYICTSHSLYNVGGLKAKVQTLLNTSNAGNVEEIKLPFNHLDGFKFPQEAERGDVMILCHSKDNRGFSITDAEGSLYDGYLKQCQQTFGEGHIIVIIHDFEFNPDSLKHLRERLRFSQPKLFKIAKYVFLAGNIGCEEIQISQEDLRDLEMFVKTMG